MSEDAPRFAAMSPTKPQRSFPVVGNGTYRPPDYARVVRRLTRDELDADIAAGRGDPEYRAAGIRELERRALEDE
jgi:hypothetical protein